MPIHRCWDKQPSSPRSYKDEKSTFDALLELLQNKEHAYDGSVIKALLYTVSLYPIGTYVYLSNRKIAEVIDTNPDNPKTPVVQILTEKEPDGSLKTLQIGENNINILRILTKQEKEDILKIIHEKYQKEKENPVSKPAAAPVEKAEITAPTPSPDPAAKEEAAPKAESEVQTEAASDGTEEVDISIFG